MKDKTAKPLTDRHMRKRLKIRVFPSGKHFALKNRLILRLEQIFMRHATLIYAYLCSMMMLLRTHPYGTAFTRTAHRHQADNSHSISKHSPSLPIFQKSTPRSSVNSFMRHADSKPLATKCIGTKSPTPNRSMNCLPPRV